MMGTRPLVSVVIPTHNRKAQLHRALIALTAQTFPLHDMEVLVVCDGCTDGTIEMFRHYATPFVLRVIRQAARGPAEARNRGAAHAAGRLLLFLDDDIEPSPSLVESHSRAHGEKSGRVVIGYLPPVVPSGRIDFFHIGLRNWWEGKFYAMRQPGYRFAYSDLLGGNFSLEAELFALVGGFDSSFRTHEDYEFGMRLVKAGVDFFFAVDALGYHHDMTDLNRSFIRKYEEGKADVLMAQRHPELRPLLPLSCPMSFSFPGRIAGALVFDCPAAGHAMIPALRQALRLLEWTRMRGLWWRLLRGLCAYWYWRGVAEISGPRSAGCRQKGSGCSPEEDSAIDIDLGEGLEAAERRMDLERPPSVRIRLGEQFVGAIPSQPGAEPLRGAHIRPILLTKLSKRMLIALAMEDVLDPFCVEKVTVCGIEGARN